MTCEDDAQCEEVEYTWTNLRNIETQVPRVAQLMLPGRADEKWNRKVTLGCAKGCTCRPLRRQPKDYPVVSVFDTTVSWNPLPDPRHPRGGEFAMSGTVTVTMVRRKGQCSTGDDEKFGYGLEVPGTGIAVASARKQLLKEFDGQFAALVGAKGSRAGKRPAKRRRSR